MADTPIPLALNCQPGIQRDGTSFDAKAYVDGQWIRFAANGRAKKMGGFRQISDKLNGPIRSLQSWSRQSIIQVTCFSPWGIEAIQLDKNGVGQALYDRTPTTYTVDGNAVWQTDTMFDAAVGSDKTLLFAHPGANLVDVDSTINRDVYYGDAAGTTPLVAIGGAIQVSGGIIAMPPFLTLYGNDGLVMWSNENEPRNFTTGSSGKSRITGGKIVKGLPIRGQGTSPSALLWSLDSVFRMSYVGGTAIFRFDPVSQGSSILSSSSVTEHDGIFYWVGIDRFMNYNGRVQELPNTQNLDWFFDNLNYAQRQKVYVSKVPRYGEIWWFFPFGDATECTHAVIYNVRGGFWYDVELPRSAATFSQSFRFPILAGSKAKKTVYRLRMNSIVGFVVNDHIWDQTSGSFGITEKILGTDLYVTLTSGTGFVAADTIVGDLGGNSTITSVATIDLHQLWVHETGKNKVEGDDEVGISSYFESCNFGFPIGEGLQDTGPDCWTRLTRIEPDFLMQGSMKVNIIGGETAQGDETISQDYEFDGDTGQIDMREQRREIRLRFTSDEAGGDFEQGKVLLHIEQGDTRN